MYSVDIYNDYMSKIEHDILSDEEFKRLFLEFKNGNIAAKNEIFMHNRKLVVSICRKINLYNTDIMDAIQIGNIALLSAIERFDFNKGYAFSTYAHTCIEGAVHRYIDEDQLVYIPVYKIQNRNKYVKEREICKRDGVSFTKIKEYEDLSKAVLSIEELKEEYGNMPAAKIELLIDNYQKEILEILTNSDLKEKYIKILVNSFGLFGYKRMTDEEIGNILGTSKQAVYQLRQKALSIFRLNYRTKYLAVYLGDEKKLCENLIIENNNYFTKMKEKNKKSKVKGKR